MKPLRKCTVTDRMITQMEIRKKSKELPKVHIGYNVYENLYTFTFLGTEISGDGNSEITAQNRCNLTIRKCNEYRSVLTNTELPFEMRLRLCIVISTVIYDSAFFLTHAIIRNVNGINSKLVA